MVYAAWMLLLFLACAPETIQPPSCNGAAEHCARPFDQVVVVGTHNSMSSPGWDFKPPNQNLDMVEQLDSGVRALNLDVYEELGALLTCHGYCSLGSRPLVEVLSELSAWLDANPDQVLSLTFEAYISAEQMVGAFEASGLIDHVATRDPAEPWPTLQQMIDSGQRLVVWTDHEGGDPAWYGDINAQVWETDYAYETVDDFDCGFRRGGEDQSYTYMAHFLTDPLASQELAAQANTAQVLWDRIAQCEPIGRSPQLILVDFAQIGEVFEVVAELNAQVE